MPRLVLSAITSTPTVKPLRAAVRATARPRNRPRSGDRSGEKPATIGPARSTDAGITTINATSINKPAGIAASGESRSSHDQYQHATDRLPDGEPTPVAHRAAIACARVSDIAHRLDRRNCRD